VGQLIAHPAVRLVPDEEVLEFSVRPLPRRDDLSLPNVWPAPDLQVNFCELVSISLQ